MYIWTQYELLFAFSLYSCEVSKGSGAKAVMGSCFLPPYQTSCSGIPSGCGSCVSQCSNGQSSSSSSSLTIINNYGSQIGEQFGRKKRSAKPQSGF